MTADDIATATEMEKVSSLLLARQCDMRRETRDMRHD